MTESAARNAPHAKPLSHVARLARLVAVAMLIPLGAQAETISYGYDPGNRLQSVECDDGQSVHYVYDNLGRASPTAPSSLTPPSRWTGRRRSTWLRTTRWSMHLGTGSNPPLVYSGWDRS